MVYKSVNGLAPFYLTDLLSEHDSEEVFEMLKSGTISGSKDNIKTSDRAFAVSAPKLCNSLPVSIRTTSTVRHF